MVVQFNGQRFLNKGDSDSDKKEKGRVVSSLTEMTGMRVIELVSETIPGAVIQGLAVMSKSGDRSFTPIVSLASSILITASISAQLTYDVDSSSAKRKQTPSHYGIFPITMSRKIFSMLLMFLISSFNLVV